MSQWRGYGDFGRGYAVGFKLKGKPHPQIGSLVDVIYGTDKLEELYDYLSDIFFNSIEKWETIICDEAARLLKYIGSCFKDCRYSEERESRIVSSYLKSENYLFQNEAPLKFRARNGEIVPYMPMSLDFLMANETAKLPISRIIVGPGLNFNRAHSAISRLLDEHGYDGIEVVRSQIPFEP
ncbi:hypothetical protein D3C80_1607860 [compost metagenome]